MEELLYATYVIYPMLALARWVMLYLDLNSVLAANLARVGLRIPWWGGEAKPLEGNPSWILKLVCLGILDCIMWVLAPLGVLLQLIYWLYSYVNNNGIPRHIKEMRWRLRNLPLTKEQVEQEFANAIKGKNE